MASIAILISNLSVNGDNLYLEGIAHVQGDDQKYGWGCDVNWTDTTAIVVLAAQNAALASTKVEIGLLDKCAIFIGTSSLL